MKIKLLLILFSLQVSLQGCLLYPSLTVEDPGFKVEFVNSKNEAIPNLDFHYSLSRRGAHAYFTEKNEQLKTNSNGVVKLPKKRSFETMLFLPHGTHSSWAHIWTWCVSNKNYLPQRGEFELGEKNYSKVILKESTHSYQCEFDEKMGSIEVLCKDPSNCPELDLYQYKHQKKFTLTPKQIKDALESIRSGNVGF